MRLVCETSSMELKVWVDGIQRVVCGATFDTTCQDVVIALAHAMGRTGRFTLIEKWRDVDRPLAPSECPLRVLYKWGEYAGEVRFVLCQADSDKQKPQDNGKLWKKTGDQSRYLHNFSPQHTPGLGGGGDASVKRSLTFSGAHNYSSNLPNLSLSSSQPTSKFQKTHLGPVPNGDVRPRPPLQQLSRQTSSPRPPGHVTGGYSGGSSAGQQIKNSGVLPHAQTQEHPVPHPRHKRASPAPIGRGLPAYGEGAQASRTTVPSSSSVPPSSALTANHQHGFLKNRVSPVPAQTAVAQSLHPSHPKPQPHARAHTPSGAHSSIPSHSHHPDPTPPPRHTHRGDNSLPHSRESTPPPLPSSLPPDVRSIPAQSNTSGLDRQRLSPDPRQALTAVEASLGSASHSRQASLEIEEYDLDRNFPDVTRDAVRGERPSVSLEYRLDDGVTAGSGGHMEGEHAKLVRLVNIQQERLKTQESQISMINTEITALEEREKEYEDQLQVIMEELLLQENRQRDLEPELAELERVEWENVLDGEKKCEQDLKRQIDSCKTRLAELEQKLEQTMKREKGLKQEISAEQEKLASEKQRLQDAETKAAEEASKLKDEIQKVKVQLSDLEKTVSECEASLSSVDGDLKSEEAELAKKTAQLEEMEKELKTENMKDFSAHPVAKETTKPNDSGETIIKILEERLSPRPPSRGPDSPSSPPFMSALAAKTQSGVWV